LRLTTICLALAAACALALLAYVCLGASVLGPVDVLLGRLSREESLLVTGFRLKRGLLALSVGGALALSGAAFQALLRNPLADPFVVGVSGGAAIGGTLVMVFFASLLPFLSPFVSSVAVFAGAFVAAVLFAALLYKMSMARGVLVTNSLLLMGVVFNFFASAVVLFLKTILQGTKLQEILFWLMGSLAVETLPDGVILLALLSLAGGLFVLTAVGRRVNLVSVSEEFSHGTGVSPERTKRVLFLTASALVAIAVSVSGFVGFVGLIVPHAVRLAVGSDHRQLFPVSTLAGGLFLLLADLASRLSGPFLGTSLPVGALTAFVGGPIFIAMLARAQRRGETV